MAELSTGARPIRAARRRRRTLAALQAWLPYLEDDVPPRHFCSPLPSPGSLEARARWWWSEAYLVHARLVGNAHLPITWCNAHLSAKHRARVGAALPLWDSQPGSSLWLETL